MLSRDIVQIGTSRSDIDNCLEGCRICKNKSWCLDCFDGYSILKSSGQCFEVCPHSYHKKDNECVPCEANCILCNPIKCTECKNGYLHFMDNYCVKNCPIGYFPYLESCISDCGTGFYLNSSGTCDCCPSSCSSCTNSSSCIECLPTFYLYEGRCVSDCPPGTFENGRSCEKCPNTNCEECGWAGLCIKCKPGFIPYQYECVENCKSVGLFQLDDKCVARCPPNTAIFQEDNRCLINCPLDWFRNESGECQKCLKGCSACSDGDSCLMCSAGLFLLRDPIHGLVDCVSECPNKQTFPVCEECSPGCQDCSPGNKAVCNRCRSTHELSVIEDKNECLICRIEPIKFARNLRKISQVGIFYDESLSDFALSEYGIIYNFPFKCSRCEENCEKCSKDGDCLLCSPGFFRNHFRSCSRQCPKGYYPDLSERKCLLCKPECQACESYDKCTECKPGRGTISLNPEGNCDLVRSSVDTNLILKSVPKFTLSSPIYPGAHLFFQKTYTLELCPLEFNCSLCHAVDLLYCTKLSKFCKQNCPNHLNCHESCEECDPTRCLRCSSNFHGMIINGTMCTCPSESPYLDQTSKKCVEKCPNDTKIIEETKECVKDCFWKSIYMESPTALTVGNTCRRSCPEGTMLVVDYSLMNSLTCAPISTNSIYTLIKFKLNGHQTTESMCSDKKLISQILQYFKGLQGENIIESIFHNETITIISKYLECVDQIEADLLHILSNILHTRSPLCYDEDDFNEFRSTVKKLLILSKHLQSSESIKIFRLLSDTSRCLYYLSSSMVTEHLNLEEDGENPIMRDFLLKGMPLEAWNFTIYSERPYWNQYLFSLSAWNKNLVEHLSHKIHINAGPIVFMGAEHDEERQDLITIGLRSVNTPIEDEFKCLIIDSTLQISSIDPIAQNNTLVCPYKVGTVLLFGNTHEESPSNLTLLLIILIGSCILLILGILFYSRKKNKKLGDSKNKKLDVSDVPLGIVKNEDHSNLEIEEQEQEQEEEEEEKTNYEEEDGGPDDSDLNIHDLKHMKFIY